MIKSGWNLYAIIIGFGMLLFLIYSLINANSFNSRIEQFRSETFSGIIVEKEDLKSGDFSLKFDTGSHRFYQIDLPNKQFEYEKFKVGDSVVKRVGGFIFDVYSFDSLTEYHFKYNVSW